MSSIWKLYQRFADDILTLFGNLMIMKILRGKNALVKKVHFDDLIMFLNSDLSDWHWNQ